MILVAWGTFAFFTSFVLFILIISWMIREYTHARRYRAILAAYQAQPVEATPVGPAWRITYVDRNKTITTIVPAKSETEAIKELVKNHNVGFDKIRSSVKV